MTLPTCRFILASVILAVLTLTNPSVAISREAEASEEASAPPAATFQDVAWLIGSWESTNDTGNRVVEHWHEPVGDLMINIFIETEMGDDGKEQVIWSELSRLWEKDGTLYFEVLSDQPGSEPTIGLSEVIAIAPCAIKFATVSFRCAEPDKPGEVLVATFVEELSGKRNENVIQYERADRDVSPSAPESDQP